MLELRRSIHNAVKLGTLSLAGRVAAGRVFGGMPHTILVIMVQSLPPKQQAMASRPALGLMFFNSAVGSYFVGLIADSIGLVMTLQGWRCCPHRRFNRYLAARPDAK